MAWLIRTRKGSLLCGDMRAPRFVAPRSLLTTTWLAILWTDKADAEAFKRARWPRKEIVYVEDAARWLEKGVLAKWS